MCKAQFPPTVTLNVYKHMAGVNIWDSVETYMYAIAHVSYSVSAAFNSPCNGNKCKQLHTHVMCILYLPPNKYPSLNLPACVRVYVCKSGHFSLYFNMGQILCKNLLQSGLNVGGPRLSPDWSAYGPPVKRTNQGPPSSPAAAVYICYSLLPPVDSF